MQDNLFSIFSVVASSSNLSTWFEWVCKGNNNKRIAMLSLVKIYHSTFYYLNFDVNLYLMLITLALNAIEPSVIYQKHRE